MVYNIQWATNGMSNRREAYNRLGLYSSMATSRLCYNTVREPTLPLGACILIV